MHWIIFRLIVVQLLPYLSGLNRAGGQAGPPAPAVCAKYYCYSQSPPAAVGLIEPARVASCSSALFAAVHGGSLGPSSLSVIFLIALKVKRENQNHCFDLEIKSTFEPPNEEWSKGNPPWTADLGVMSRDANKAIPSAK
ncbi:hypothetical protein [Yersinia proxima]|uniref:hypothetical protein n=1 Tax=Yersinia proxima TaxID=2890316 RepID=UPI0009845705|nr:hypothetical protein [Yersinia proxima]